MFLEYTNLIKWEIFVDYESLYFVYINEYDNFLLAMSYVYHYYWVHRYKLFFVRGK